jgi:hypothetical protein
MALGYSASKLQALKNGLTVAQQAIQNAANSTDPNTALLGQIAQSLQTLVTRLAPDTNRVAIQFTTLGNGLVGVSTSPTQLNNLTINGFINSMVAGTIYVYLSGTTVSDPTNPPPPDLIIEATSAGSSQIHIPPYVVNNITFFVAGTTAAFGSIQAITY